MKKIAQGLPLKKYIGNTHKNGGIMVNALGNKTKDVNKAVAEVEGGEYNFRYDSTNPMNNYIIPARETFPEVNDMAKQADRFKGNNRIDYNTRTNLLNKSMKLNEMLRVQQEQQQPMQMALGGGLNNNPFDKQPPKQKDSVFRRVYQSTPMNIVKMFDPTGASSYLDVKYSIDDYNKGKGSKSDIALNVLGALPIIGKAKPLITFAKGTSKSKKVLNTVTKLGDLAGDIERFPTKVAKDFTEGARKPIAKLVNKSTTNLLNFNDVIRNTIVPPLNPKRIPTKSATKSDMINAGTSLVNIGNLGSDVNSISKKQLGGKLKKYKPGGPLPYDGTNPMDDVSMQNSYRAVSTPGNEITNTPIQPTAPLLSGSQKFELPTKIQSVNPKVNTLDVSKEMEQASSPVKQKKNNFKGALSAVSGAVSALGPIGQGIGAAIQLAPYAIDLGKAMFDKTSVQDLQTQGSAMRLPNTTYAKNGGKLNVVPLPKLANGGDTLSVKDINPFEKVIKKEGTVSSGRVDILNPFYRRTEQTVIPSTKVTGTVPSGRVDMNNPFNRNNSSTTTGTIPSGRVEGNPFDRRKNPIVKTGVLTNNTGKLETDPFNTGNPLFNKLQLTPIVDINNPFNRNRDLVDPFNLNKDKKKSTVTEKKDTPVTTTDNKDNAGKNKGNTKSSKGSTGSKSTPTTNTTPTTTSTNMLPSRGLMLPGASSIVQAAKARFDKDNLEREKEYDALVGNALSKFNSKGVTTPTTTQTTENTEVPQSESSRLYKAGQTKQKLSEALMYGMAALPSEQIKTITPDYGRGDDAMSRMGLSTEPIRQEMMQGANKALELTRSQVGTAGQLQSRGQSIMSNVGSQLAQSQIQQQQYLNQLRAALAQREDTKANVLAQSELIAREARSAERAAKLDQLNNAISQTSAIGAGTMEQASKMSTIENENERFKRQQMQLMDMANMAGGFKVAIKDGKAVLEYDATGSGKSNIKQADLSNPNPLVVKDNPVAPATTTTPKEHVVKQGEGFNDIAAKYKIPVDKLLKLNNLKIGDTIHPNQKLKIE